MIYVVCAVILLGFILFTIAYGCEFRERSDCGRRRDWWVRRHQLDRLIEDGETR